MPVQTVGLEKNNKLTYFVANTGTARAPPRAVPVHRANGEAPVEDHSSTLIAQVDMSKLDTAQVGNLLQVISVHAACISDPGNSYCIGYNSHSIWDRYTPPPLPINRMHRQYIIIYHVMIVTSI